ncbi:MAG TPA: hypothetical protein VG994_16960 [Steroidobacteraceae bacterium]|nr:hypothetical protein [Steroidobacteraceae bacterium]
MRRIQVTGFRSAFFLLLLVAFADSTPAADAQPANPQCSRAEDFAPDVRRALLSADPKLYQNARALVGVDILGRVAIAIDSDRDTFVDEYLLFTDQTRLTGPWSAVLDVATVFRTSGSVRVEASDRSLGIALAVEDASLPELSLNKRKFAKTVVRSSGVALVRVPAAGEATPFAGLDYNSIQTWPASFQQDTLAPTTTGCSCENAGSDSGGAVH